MSVILTEQYSSTEVNIKKSRLTVYLDNASTTFPKPTEVCEAVRKYMEEGCGNPGRSAGNSPDILSDTRRLIKDFINAPSDSHVVLTYSATDSLNLAIKGFLSKGNHVITTSMEHNSVLRPLHALKTKGIIELTIVEANQVGCIDPEQIKKAITKETALIVCTHASNVTGTIMPLKEIGAIAAENNIKFLVDSSQGIGALPIDVDDMNIDLLAFPGHKNLFAPAGTGALWIRAGINLEPFRHGGTGKLSDTLSQPEELPFKYESGTCNLIGIAGLNAGIRFIMSQGVNKIREHEMFLVKYLMEQLSEMDVTIYGPKPEEKASVVSINVDSKSPEEVSKILADKFDIVTRSGLLCAPLAHKTIGSYEKGGTLRISPGYFNTITEIDCIVQAIRSIRTRNLRNL